MRTWISLMVLALLPLNYLSAADTIYKSNEEKSKDQAIGYAKHGQTSSRYLAYRDIPFFITNYVKGNKTLDYGSGAGFSTRFLCDLNMEAEGVDISEEMLAQASMIYPEIPFYFMQNGNIPALDQSYDLVFSSYVLFELGSEQEVLNYLGEAKRVMKEEGVLIAVTGSQDMYTRDWYIFNTDYPENKNLESGDLARIYLREAEIEFTDFYWTEADYRLFFKKAGFDLLEVHYPLGKEDEGYAWKDEVACSPFVVFVAKKQ